MIMHTFSSSDWTTVHSHCNAKVQFILTTLNLLNPR